MPVSTNVSSAAPNAEHTNQKTNYGALSTLITVFFFWGFVAAGNSVFIPFCKNFFNLDQFQSQLIDFAFYLAYYLGALALFAYGLWIRNDLVSLWGYKKTIITGLIISAIGALFMVIAVHLSSFNGMLMGLFVVALGFSLQQTAAQPFAISLGNPATGASRINLGGGINSLGTAIGPLVVALALFGTTKAISEEQISSLPLHKVLILYSIVGCLFILAALLFGFSKKLPNNSEKTGALSAQKALKMLVFLSFVLLFCFIPVFWSYQQQGTNVLPNAISELEFFRLKWLIAALVFVILTLLFVLKASKRNPIGWGAMQYPQLVMGMLAIFVYVGVEVSLVSNLSELLTKPEFGGFETSEVAPFIALYWGSLMIGRWTGAIGAFNFSNKTRKLLTIVVPLIAFGVVLFVTAISGYSIKILIPFVLVVFLQIVAFFIAKDRPAILLLIFAVLGFLAILFAVLGNGLASVYAIISGGLFCSIMWPAIFNLSLAGLGKHTTQGAAFLIMMIVGGAVIPPIQGKLADYIATNSNNSSLGIHQSYFLAVLCFAFIAFFAFFVRRVLKGQGIDYDKLTNDNQ